MEVMPVHVARGGVAEVVFDVAPADGGFRKVVRREFVEDGFQRFVEDVGEHIQLPRWAMPISMWETPAAGQRLIMASSRTMAPSPPSREKRFSPMKCLPRNPQTVPPCRDGRRLLSGLPGHNPRRLPGVDFFFNPGADSQIVYVVVFKADGSTIDFLQPIG